LKFQSQSTERSLSVSPVFLNLGYIVCGTMLLYTRILSDTAAATSRGVKSKTVQRTKVFDQVIDLIVLLCLTPVHQEAI